MVERVALWCYTHRWRVVALWVVALVAFITLGNVAGGAYASDFSLRGAESQQALDLLKQRFPSHSGDTAVLVFKADQGVNDPAVKSRMERLFSQVATLHHVDAVTDPYGPS